MSLEKHAENLDLKGMVVTMILGAFGFLVALQWRDAIKLTIDTFLPAGEGIIYSYMVAIIVTVIAVVVAYLLIKFKEMDIIPDRHEERFKNGFKKRAKKLKRE